MRDKRFQKFFTILACIGPLAGCADMRGWMDPETVIFTEGWTERPAHYQPAPLYCYETLGRTDCYPTPQNFTGQLKASYPPATPQGSFPEGRTRRGLPPAVHETLFSTWPFGAK